MKFYLKLELISLAYGKPFNEMQSEYILLFTSLINC